MSERLKSGDIVGCGRTVPRLTHKDIEQTVRIVAQMGPEPFVEAMISNPDFDIIIGGRSYDPAPYMAWCAYHALKQKSGSIHTLGKEAMGAFAHMGKILECGGQCATPKSNAAAAMVYQTGAFDIIPLDPNSKCVPYSVAAHVLYENSRPDVLYGPGGYMDLTKVTYEQLEDGRSVRVRGCTFHTSQSQGQRYTVKLEGGKIAGFRTVFIGSYRDPILISQLDNLFARIKGYVKMQHKHVKEFWDIEFHVYGLNEGGTTTSSSNGIFVVGEAIAESQQIASSVASTARIACIHAPYQGQKATAGNFGFGIGGKFEFEVSECTEFSIYHLMFLKDGEEGAVRATSHEVGINNEETAKGLFHWTKTTIGRGEDTGPADTEHTNGINGTNGTNGTTHGAEDPGNKANLPIPAAVASSEPRVLSDIAKVVRSKNAGPYEITLDVIFESPAVYELVKSCGLLSADLIAKLYNISSEDIIWCGYYDVALAFKATIPRKRNGIFTSAGGFMENDVHGSQHHTELLMLDLGSEFIQQLAGLSKQSGTEGPRL